MYSYKSSVGPAIVGGLLFGGIGAVAGAMAVKQKDSAKTKEDYAVRFMLNDIEMALIELHCESREIAYRVAATFELWEKQIKESKGQN